MHDLPVVASGVPARPAKRRSKALPVPPDFATCPIATLVQLAAAAGVEFRLEGAETVLSNTIGLASDLRQALVARGDALWGHLGGVSLEAVTALLTAQQVEVRYPRSEAAARDALREIVADAAHHMPAELRPMLPWLACDTETAADPGQRLRPPIKLKRDGYPMEHQAPLLETAGLDPHRSQIRLVQLYGGGRRCLVWDTTLLPWALLLPVLEQHTLLIHNVVFDLRFLHCAGLDLDRVHYEDLMQAAGLLYGAGNRKLDHVAHEVLGVTLPKGLQRSAWHARQLSAAQIAYAGADAVAVYCCWPILRRRLIETERGAAYVLQRDVSRPAVRLVERGVTLDTARHAALVQDWERQHAAAVVAFEQQTKQPLPDGSDALRSYLQGVLPPALLAQWNVTPKKHQLSIRANDLRRVAHLPGIRELLVVHGFEKLRNSFGASLVDKISIRDGRLHPSLNIASAKTGRASSNGPNVQQLPRGKTAPGFRSCITARPGYVLVVADYSMMELRAAACLSGDQQMLQDFADGIDLHRRLAASTLGITDDAVTPEQRTSAKPIAFASIYGAGPTGIAASAWANYGIAMTLDQATRALQTFFARYPTLAGWMRTHHHACMLQGHIKIGSLGRVIEAAWETPKERAKQSSAADDTEDAEDDFDPYASDAVWGEASAPANGFFPQTYAGAALRYTLSCNAPVQGACADAAMLALLRSDQALRAAGIDGGPVLFVHDELALEIVVHHAQQAEVLLREAMIRAFATTFPTATLYKLVDSCIGPNWESAKPG